MKLLVTGITATCCICFCLSCMETVILLWKLAVVDEAVKKEQMRVCQLLINRLNECKKVWSDSCS